MMEDKTKHFNYEIMCNLDRLKKITKKTNFSGISTLSNGVILTKCLPMKITYDRPVQVACHILEHAKLLNLKFLYESKEKMKKQGFEQSIQLSDTDSFLLVWTPKQLLSGGVEAKFWKALSHLSHWFDTGGSNWDSDRHPFFRYNSDRKEYLLKEKVENYKKIGLLKGKCLFAFLCLCHFFLFHIFHFCFSNQPPPPSPLSPM